MQSGSAEALRTACATPDDVGGGGGPLLRGQLRSEARGGADEVAAEILLPCGGGTAGSLQPRLQKASTESNAIGFKAVHSNKAKHRLEVAPCIAGCLCVAQELPHDNPAVCIAGRRVQLLLGC